MTLVGLAAVFAAAAAVRLVVGNDLGWSGDAGVMGLRADRLLAGTIVGAALATGGVLLQSLLRNPLASPDLIGAAAGAGFAVMLSTLVGVGGGLALGPAFALHAPAALVGSLGALALVYGLAQRRGFIEPVSLVLIGVIVSVVCGAATMLLAFLRTDQGLDVARWMVGSISDDLIGWPVWAVGGVTLVGIALGAGFGRAMDVAALGDDEALSSGVNIATLRLALFVLSGVLTAAAVVLAGPIGFVGLVCPHVVRLLAGPGHRAVVIGAALAGATLVVLADAAGKAVAVWTMHGRVPIGIITALVGGPVFIGLLRRDTGRGGGNT
jgi:iron complex transport system permease protein